MHPSGCRKPQCRLRRVRFTITIYRPFRRTQEIMKPIFDNFSTWYKIASDFTSLSLYSVAKSLLLELRTYRVPFYQSVLHYRGKRCYIVLTVYLGSPIDFNFMDARAADELLSGIPLCKRSRPFWCESCLILSLRLAGGLYPDGVFWKTAFMLTPEDISALGNRIRILRRESRISSKP